MIEQICQTALKHEGLWENKQKETRTQRAASRTEEISRKTSKQDHDWSTTGNWFPDNLSRSELTAGEGCTTQLPAEQVPSHASISRGGAHCQSAQATAPRPALNRFRWQPISAQRRSREWKRDAISAMAAEHTPLQFPILLGSRSLPHKSRVNNAVGRT